jgi:hypothetical protein
MLGPQSPRTEKSTPSIKNSDSDSNQKSIAECAKPYRFPSPTESAKCLAIGDRMRETDQFSCRISESQQ